MSVADKIAEARALIKPLTGHTPGPWMQDGIAIAHPSEPHGYPLDICLMGEPLHFAGDVRPMLQNHEANARLIAAAPALRDTVAALADLADAQAQEVAEWRKEYRAVQSMNDLLRAANAKMIAERDAQAQENARLKAALEWYGAQARLCRLIHSEGNIGRHAIQEDGGKRARAALGEAP